MNIVKKHVADQIDEWVLNNGHDEFRQYNDYLKDFADSYVEDYEEYCHEITLEGQLPVDFGPFLAEIVGVEPEGAGDYAVKVREDEAYEQAERYRDEFGY